MASHVLDQKKKEAYFSFHKDRPKRVKIFDNSILERLTLVRWYTPILFWGPVIVLLSYFNIVNYQVSPLKLVLSAISGLLTWTLAEYLIHRFPFHLNLKSGPGKRTIYIIHGNHHDDPADPLRGVMPIVPAIIYSLLLYGLFSLFIPANMLGIFFAGFMLGYLFYDEVHFFIHQINNPKSRTFRYLRRLHLVHHVHDDILFGITTPLWDKVFGTYHKKGVKLPKF